MRGLSGWFDQVSTDDIKKANQGSIYLAGLSISHLPVGAPRNGIIAPRSAGLSFYRALTIIALHFLAIHVRRSTHPQITIYMDIFKFTRELMEIESVSWNEGAAGRWLRD